MRALLVLSTLALLAGGGPARARSPGRHHPHARFHHRLTGAGPGAPELKSWLEALRTGDPRLCALAVGTAQAVLDYTISYCNDRKAFGEPISHRQNTAHFFIDFAVRQRRQ